MTFTRSIIVALLSSSAVVGAQNFAIPDWKNSVQFELVVSQKQVRPGDSFELALVAYIEDGYHLYGPEEQKPSRIEVAVEGTELSSGEPVYPPVIRRELSGLGEYDLYEDQIAIRVPVTLKKDVKAGSLEARLNVSYQICTDYACSAPASDELVIDLEIAEANAKVQLLYLDIFTNK
jgi:DsbC/DsbD-like thiol-disulfide interchange protein